jgi:arylsulfatase A-like enzyme
VDHQVGRILDVLEQMGKLGSSVVILTSDHGEALGERGEIGHGLSLYDESSRVPLLVSLPGIRGRDIDVEVGLIDVGPTILDLAGVAIPSSMHGFKLTHIMEPHTHDRRPPVLMDTWRSELGESEPSIDLIGIVQDGYKVVIDWSTWTFRYLRVTARREVPLPMKKGSPHHMRFERLTELLLGWYCSVPSQRGRRRCD